LKLVDTLFCAKNLKNMGFPTKYLRYFLTTQLKIKASLVKKGSFQ